MSLIDSLDRRGMDRQFHEKKKKDRYFENLERYRAFMASRDGDHPRRYRELCIPFQLVVESDEEMFTNGLGSGMEQARRRMREAITNLLAKQVLEKFWSIDSFQGADGKLCFGMTAYLLTDEEMGILEDELKEIDRGSRADRESSDDDQSE